MDFQAEIRRIAESKLTDPAHFIVEVVISAKRGPAKVLVILDGDKGVTIEDCATVSRELSKALDEVPNLEESYTLEVTTPGLDQPLKLLRQYVKNIGRKLKVRLADKTLEGLLSAADPEKIILDLETGSGKKKEVTTVEIPFSEIEKAFVIISFK